MAKKQSKAELDAKKILSLPSTGQTEDELIKQQFEMSKLRRIQALWDELENGKGAARLQAEARLEILEKEIKEQGEDISVDMDWDIVATRDAKTA